MARRRPRIDDHIATVATGTRFRATVGYVIGPFAAVEVPQTVLLSGIGKPTGVGDDAVWLF